MQYMGNSGNIYNVVDKRIAHGGEGDIKEIIGMPSQVAKIFKEKFRTAERQEKLSVMIKKKLSPEQLEMIAWPQDVIYDSTGFVGYIMPKIENKKSLTILYSEKKYDLQDRLLAATNLCAAIDMVHEMGSICGDLNPQNICVNLDKNDSANEFKISLVDVDSYHYETPEKTYRCEVGLPEYIAPEMQKKLSQGYSIKDAPLPTYTRETDLFALAVHIFCLLMEGCHPFACAKDFGEEPEYNIGRMTSENMPSVVAPQPIENIRDGFFPFYEKRKGITTPIYAPGFEALPQSLQELFKKTFVDGYQNPEKRVSAGEWYEALYEVRENITKCQAGHYYFNHLSECPFCMPVDFDNSLGKVPESDHLGGLSDNPSESDDFEEPSYNIPYFDKNKYSYAKDPKVQAKIIFAIMIFVSIIAWGIITRNDILDDINISNTAPSMETVGDLSSITYKQAVSYAKENYKIAAYDTALEWCDFAIQKETKKASAYLVKAKVLYRRGNYDESKTIINWALNYTECSENVKKQFLDLSDKIDKKGQ